MDANDCESTNLPPMRLGTLWDILIDELQSIIISEREHLTRREIGNLPIDINKWALEGEEARGREGGDREIERGEPIIHINKWAPDRGRERERETCDTY